MNKIVIPNPNPFVHLWNTHEDLLNEISDLSLYWQFMQLPLSLQKVNKEIVKLNPCQVSVFLQKIWTKPITLYDEQIEFNLIIESFFFFQKKW